MYFDTHAHYDDKAFDFDRDSLLAKMPSEGISLIVNPGSGRESSEMAQQIAGRYDHVYAAIGWHPHEASKMGTDGEDFLARCALSKKVVAIGEIGLDYHYDFSPRDIQRDVFIRQMVMALDLKLPVIVHDRDAHSDCLDIISRFPGVTGVFHCYSGSAQTARRIIELGWYLSFTGTVTFKNARRSLETISEIPRDRIMLETDCPYLSPVPNRGKRNDSTNLPFIAHAVGQAIGLSQEETALLTMENGRRFFGI